MIYCFTAFFSNTAWFIALLQFFVSVQYYKNCYSFFHLYYICYRLFKSLFMFGITKKKKKCFSFFFLFVSVQSVVLNFFLTNDSVRLQFLFFGFEDCSFEYGITLSVRFYTICCIRIFF